MSDSTETDPMLCPFEALLGSFALFLECLCDGDLEMAINAHEFMLA
jgi:hypothetical protein